MGGLRTAKGMCPRPGWDTVNIPALSASQTGAGTAYSAVVTLPKAIDTTFNTDFYNFTQHLLAAGYTVSANTSGTIALQGLVNGAWVTLLSVAVVNGATQSTYTVGSGTLVGNLTAFRVAVTVTSAGGGSIINTVAGNHVQGYSGDGAAATLAKMYAPTSVVTDSLGDMFICDSRNAVVRKVTKSTGFISTVAGQQTKGGTYSGNGGAATSAGMSTQNGSMIIDASLDMFIADDYNCSIRKVTQSTGLISTVAGNGPLSHGYSGDGGQATGSPNNAQLNFPGGVAFDINGNILIADTINNVVREVFIATGVIFTYVGYYPGTAGYSGDGGSANNAKLTSPTGLAIDGAGNLYIADNGNQAIRRVTSSGSGVSTVAGGNGAGYSGDGGSATAAKLSGPYGVSVDASGDIFIADTTNNVVREVTAGAVGGITAGFPAMQMYINHGSLENAWTV